MKLNRRNHARNSERGSAMIIALLTLLLISAIGVGMMYMSTTETNVNANYRDSQKAYYAARAGLEEARERLRPTSADPITPPAGMPNTGAPNILYIKNPLGTETIDPTDSSSKYYDKYLCNEQFSGFNLCSSTTPGPPATAVSTPLIASVVPGTGAADALSYKWVRITNKTNVSSAPTVDSAQAGSNPGGQVCWNGLQEVVIGLGQTCAGQPLTMFPVWTLTSLAVTRGGSQRLAQMEVSLDNISTNATVASQTSVGLQGSLNINAYDNCTCDLTQSPPTSLPGKSCINNKYGVYTAGGISTSGNAYTISSGQTGGSPAGTAANQTWPYDITSMINKYKSMPGVVAPFGSSCSGYSGSTCSVAGANYGATDANFNPLAPGNMNPQITYIPGNAQLTSNVTGSGILIVDGDLDLHGGFEWYGLVLVKGHIDFTGGGNDNVNLYGSFLNGQDVTAVNDTIGGSVVLRYDSCALNILNQKHPPIMLSSRELPY